MIDTLVIPAGGRGLRLKERLGDTPKPMAPINGKPLLEHQIEWAKKNGIKEVFILVGHGADDILVHFFNKGHWIRFFKDQGEPGTAGALMNVIDVLPEQFVLLYGDLMIDLTLEPFRRFHDQMNADVSLFLHSTDHPADSDLVEIDGNNWVGDIYRDPLAADSGLSSAGLHIINRSALEHYCIQPFKDFGKDLLPLMLSDPGRIAGFVGIGYIKDIGTPERYDEVCADFAEKT